MTEPFETGNESSVYASDNEALLIGIDLGTSRSSIAALNGVRDVIESYVGWPKDSVALRHLKKKVVFGKEALDNRLSVNLFRPLEKGVLKHTLEKDVTTEATQETMSNERAARELIHHLVQMARPERDQRVYGVMGVPAQASIKSKQALIEAAKDSMDAVMLVSQPFAVAYGQNLLDGSMIIDIGAGTVDICRMHGTVPEEADQISLTTAGDEIDRKFEELLRERYPDAQFTINMLKKIKERHAFVAGQVEKVTATFPCDGRPTEYDVTEMLKEASESIIGGISTAVHTLVASFDPEFQDRLKSNILLSGGGSQIVGLASRLQDALKDLGDPVVSTVEQPLYAGVDGALKLATDMPDEYWQKLS
jgi:rod shape-determining protein MreB